MAPRGRSWRSQDSYGVIVKRFMCIWWMQIYTISLKRGGHKGILGETGSTSVRSPTVTPIWRHCVRYVDPLIELRYMIHITGGIATTAPCQMTGTFPFKGESRHPHQVTDSSLHWAKCGPRVTHTMGIMTQETCKKNQAPMCERLRISMYTFQLLFFLFNPWNVRNQGYPCRGGSFLNSVVTVIHSSFANADIDETHNMT